ncbi:ribonuclease HII [Oceanobacillus luteolus]
MNKMCAGEMLNMNTKSIAVIRQMFEHNEITEELIEQLKRDERKGVQVLLHKYEKEKLKKEQQLANFEEMLTYEKHAKNNGHQYIAGVDEAGRGPLAGPVVAASVILPDDFVLLGLNDSKQLTEKERENFFDIIIEQAVSYNVAVISNEQIDHLNILEATKLAMYQAVDGLSQKPDHVLLDAVALPQLTMSFDVIVKGDAKSITIAAASILAKVTRDRLMRKIHNEYPMYDFNSNMGYGTKKHMESLERYGASPYHRRSFAPVRKFIGQ